MPSAIPATLPNGEEALITKLGAISESSTLHLRSVVTVCRIRCALRFKRKMKKRIAKRSISCCPVLVSCFHYARPHKFFALVF